MNVTRIALVASLIFSFSFAAHAASCPTAAPSNTPGFCSSFKVAAQCHCSKSLPAGMCTDERQLYKRMTAAYGSLQRACESQHETSAQECVDDWNCYLSGGLTSKSELCSGSGTACI
ncbi:MAG: hypothetical protein Q8R24_10930 [Legionellaceae bacterium]|nr:hypothetical protein [Legionellaceae bacterium]